MSVSIAGPTQSHDSGDEHVDGERYMVEAALLREVILSDFLTPGQRSRLQSRYDQARVALR